VLNGLKNAFRIKELREKILFTIAMLVVYRIGAHVPVPGIPFQGMLGLFSTDNNSVAAGAMALLNLFSGGALSYVSVFSLGIMPYITSSIILQMLQAVVPSLHELAREGEVGQTKITQYSPWLWQSSTPWVTSSSSRASASALLAPALPRSSSTS
jgi:preprotein translocase subunit SecY